MIIKVIKTNYCNIPTVHSYQMIVPMGRTCERLVSIALCRPGLPVQYSRPCPASEQTKTIYFPGPLYLCDLKCLYGSIFVLEIIIFSEIRKRFYTLDQAHPTRIPGKYLLLNQLIPGWLAKLEKFKILAGKLKM